MRKWNVERVRHAQRFIVSDSRATAEWARERYQELAARGEAHVRLGKLFFIDATGEKGEVLRVDVDEYVRDVKGDSGVRLSGD